MSVSDLRCHLLRHLGAVLLLAMPCVGARADDAAETQPAAATISAEAVEIHRANVQLDAAKAAAAAVVRQAEEAAAAAKAASEAEARKAEASAAAAKAASDADARKVEAEAAAQQSASDAEARKVEAEAAAKQAPSQAAARRAEAEASATAAAVRAWAEVEAKKAEIAANRAIAMRPKNFWDFAIEMLNRAAQPPAQALSDAESITARDDTSVDQILETQPACFSALPLQPRKVGTVPEPVGDEYSARQVDPFSHGPRILTVPTSGNQNFVPDVTRPATSSSESADTVHYAFDFRFDQAARFPLPEYGATGGPVGNSGVVIYEGMRLAIQPNGRYQVRFTVATPAMPVTMNLQFVLLRQSTGEEIRLTLPAILVPSRKNSLSSLSREPAPQVFAGLETIVHDGYLPAFAINNEQWIVIKRQGTARFGYGVDVP